jgi:hypothetical protein
LSCPFFPVSGPHIVVEVFPLIPEHRKINYPVDFLKVKFLGFAFQTAAQIVNASNDDLSIPFLRMRFSNSYSA